MVSRRPGLLIGFAGPVLLGVLIGCSTDHADVSLELGAAGGQDDLLVLGQSADLAIRGTPGATISLAIRGDGELSFTPSALTLPDSGAATVLVTATEASSAEGSTLLTAGDAELPITVATGCSCASPAASTSRRARCRCGPHTRRSELRSPSSPPSGRRSIWPVAIRS